eukprot:g38993.t1
MAPQQGLWRLVMRQLACLGRNLVVSGIMETAGGLEWHQNRTPAVCGEVAGEPGWRLETRQQSRGMEIKRSSPDGRVRMPVDGEMAMQRSKYQARCGREGMVVNGKMAER